MNCFKGWELCTKTISFTGTLRALISFLQREWPNWGISMCQSWLKTVSVPLRLELLTIPVLKFGVDKNTGTNVIFGRLDVLSTSCVVWRCPSRLQISLLCTEKWQKGSTLTFLRGIHPNWGDLSACAWPSMRKWDLLPVSSWTTACFTIFLQS